MTLVDFWVYLMYVAAISYFGLGIVITIGGWFDVWQMLRRLNEEHKATRPGEHA